jgi:hypothetical protein
VKATMTVSIDPSPTASVSSSRLSMDRESTPRPEA